MRIKIKKGRVTGEIIAPPSKSIAHRLLIAAALSKGKSTVRGISDCEDVLATIDCLKSLGVKIEIKGNDAIVYGGDIKNAKPVEPLFCRESGSTLRFLLPIAMLSENETVFKGADRLMSRPMEVYENIAAEKGLDYKKENSRICVCGPLKSGKYKLPANISSQFVTGLLFALPLMEGDSEIILTTNVESRSYIDLTIQALGLFGVSVIWSDNQTLKIKGCQEYRASDVIVEGDASGAVFMDALNLFEGKVNIKGLNPNSIQGDAVYPKLFRQLEFKNPTISLGDCPDLAPILFAVSAVKNGGTFLDTARLKVKESDRAQAMAEELAKFGTRVIVNENSVVIDSSQFHAPGSMLYGHNDHRIVMALAVLCTITGGEIDGAEAISKSYPAFFDHLCQLGIEVENYGIK